MKVFAGSGRYLGRFGRDGCSALAIHPIDQTLYVADDTRIQVFSPDSQFVREIPCTEHVSVGMAFSSDASELFVAFKRNAVAAINTTDGKLLRTMFTDKLTPGGLAVDRNGLLHIVNWLQNQIVVSQPAKALCAYSVVRATETASFDEQRASRFFEALVKLLFQTPGTIAFRCAFAIGCVLLRFCCAV